MDREKVIKGLECHQIDKDHRINCSDCPYHCDEFMNGLNELHNDAIALLKEQDYAKDTKDVVDEVIENLCHLSDDEPGVCCCAMKCQEHTNKNDLTQKGRRK